MIGRSARIAVEVLIGVFAGVLILAGIGVWRLSSGPVPVDFLTPYLEAAFNEGRDDVQIEIGETVLTWEGWARSVDLRARRTRVRDLTGATLAELPDVAVTLSMRALLQGTVAPTVVEIIGPRLTLLRDADGQISFRPERGPDDSEDERDLSATLPLLVDELLSEPDPDRPLAFLRAVRLANGALLLRDEALGIAWEAEDVTLELRRDSRGLAGDLDLRLTSGSEPAGLRFTFVYDPANPLLDVNGSFVALRPDLFAPLLPDPELAAGLDLALNGTVKAVLSLDGRIDAVGFEIGGGPGSIAVPSLLPEPRPLNDLILRGSYKGNERSLTLETAELRLGELEQPGPIVAGSGTAQVVAEGIEIVAAAAVSALPIAQLADYWPLGLSENARSWVAENITAGTAEEATLSLAVTVPLPKAAEAEAADAGAASEGTAGESGEAAEEDDAGESGEAPEVVIEALSGSIRYSNLEVHYLRPMPPVTAVSGTATYDQTGMAFDVAGGRAGELEILETEVAIDGFQAEDQELDINVPVVGSLRDMLLLLNHERLQLSDRVGIDPETAEGQAAARASFHFPLLADLKIDEMEIVAKANMTGVGLRDLFLGQDASNGRLSLEVDTSAMQVAGSLDLGPQPLEVEWTENFSDAAAERSLIKATAMAIDDAQRAALGFDIWPDLKGPVAASVVAHLMRDETARVDTAINLQDAWLAAPFLQWEKPVGAPGEARASLRLVQNRLVALEALSLDTETLKLSGAGRFDAAGRALDELTLEQFVFGDTMLTDVTVKQAKRGHDIFIGGGDLDAAPFVNSTETKETAEAASDGEAPVEEGEPVAEETDAGEPIKLRTARLNTLRFADQRYLTDVTLDIERNEAGWQRLRLEGLVPPALWAAKGPLAEDNALPEDQTPRQVAINYYPAAADLHKLEVASNDMGAVLRALDILDTVQGGELTISGEEPAGQALTAEIDATGFTVIDAPVLARLLIVASLTGIVEGLSGDGIWFDRLAGEVKVDEGLVTSELVRAYGKSLGLTAQGALDLEQSKIDIDGTIVPAYLLNRILGNIPLLGPILTGGEGQGVVAFTYEMEGELEQPEISVNPLSALAPGFLRSLIGGDYSDGEPIDLPAGADR